MQEKVGLLARELYSRANGERGATPIENPSGQALVSADIPENCR